MKFQFDAIGGNSATGRDFLYAAMSLVVPGQVHVHIAKADLTPASVNVSPEDALKFAKCLVIAAEAAASEAI